MQKQSSPKTEDFHIKGFLETSFSDWPGSICAMVFLPGCNFRCPYCHNHPLVLEPDSLPDWPFDQIVSSIRKMGDFLDGVCITGGEPLVNPQIEDIIESFLEAGIAVKLDTNGSRPERLEKLIKAEVVSFVAMDVKAPFDDIMYSKAAGVSVSAERIRRSFDILKESGIDFHIRTTVVPSILKKEDVLKLARQIKGAKRFTLQNYNPENPLDPALKKVKPFTEEELAELQAECDKILAG